MKKIAILLIGCSITLSAMSQVGVKSNQSTGLSKKHKNNVTFQ